MNLNKYIISTLVLFLGFMNSVNAQKCHDFHKSNDCAIVEKENFKLSSLSRSHYLEIGKKLTYEAVIYGNQEVIIKCCTEEKYFPVRFILKSALNGDIIYDNKNDNYINFIQLNLDRTELISIEITVDTKEKALQGTQACVGMAIYMEKTKLRQ